MKIVRAVGLRPWTRGPLLLARRPGVALALAAAAFVATLPAAAAAPFLSSSRSATLHRQIARTCQWDVGTTVSAPLYPPYGDFEDLLRDEREIAEHIPRMGPQVASLLVQSVGRTSTRPDIPTALTLLARDGSDANVTVEQGPSGEGAWLPNEYADDNRLKVGDVITMTAARMVPEFPDAQPVPVRVAAIYKDLRRVPTTPYWCSYETTYRGDPGAELDDPPPHLVLLDRASLLRVAAGQHTPIQLSIERAVRDTASLTQPQAEQLGRQLEQLRNPPQQRNNQARFHSAILRQANRAEFVRRSMVGPVVPITAAGVLVGLLVVAASAAFWVQRRRQELAVLAAHGVGTAALGLKAVMESLPALIIGSAAGWAAAWWLVKTAGPSPILSPEAPRLAMAGSAATLAAATVIVGVTAARRCRPLADEHTGRRHIGSLPWELLLLAAAYPLWRLLDDRTEFADTNLGAVATVPARLLVVPILVTAGAAVLAVRIGAAVLRKIPTKTVKPGKLLTRRRLIREAGTVATLAAAIAIPIALAAYGAVVNATVRATLAAEARFIVGADVVISLAEPAPIPPALRDRATEVYRLDGTIIDGIQTDILGVDPETFPRAAFTDPRLTTRTLAEAMDSISATHGLASDVVPDGHHEIEWRGDPLLTADIEPIGRLPAQRSSYPVLLLHRDALKDSTATAQLWVRGDPDEIIRIARDAKLPLTRITVADRIFIDTIFEPVTYTFAYLSALSLLTGLVTVVGLLLYLEARAPRHRRAYIMLRRMGLRPRTHVRLVAAELAVPLVAGLLIGLAIATALAIRLAPDFEVNPQLLPDTVLTPPTATLVAIAAAVIGVTAAGTLYAHRRVTSARPGEVLRE